MILATKKSGRQISDVRLIAVTKKFSCSAIQSAIDSKIYYVGESRVQETAQKLTNFTKRKKIEIHLIGKLQKNKVRKAIKLYDVIQTINTISLAEKINIISKEENTIQRIYLQVNTGKDPKKQGFNPNELLKSSIEINKLPNIIVEGIMMIPPLRPINNKYRDIYTKTRELRDNIIEEGIISCKYLSMGMTRDFELAIEEGATHVRLGTALFGKRPL